MSPKRSAKLSSKPADVASRPHIAEWFGYRVFPTVAGGDTPLADQSAERCPFLTKVLKNNTPCVKKPESRGVCTISASSNGKRQDWLVCPYRALDDSLLGGMVRRLYGISLQNPVFIRPVLALEDADLKSEILHAVHDDVSGRVFVYFQDKLGGEIGLSKTVASPRLSFDITVIELLPADSSSLWESEPAVAVGKYGVIEIQTTDTHGSYLDAVTWLRKARDKYKKQFPDQVTEHPEWPGDNVEGPNISNVFKRTIYQITFKFQVTKRDQSVGCLLALPRPVWDSWQPFLGAPDLDQQRDGTLRLLDDKTVQPRDWIYVFDISEEPNPDQPALIQTSLVIGTDASSLSNAVFVTAPAKALAHSGHNDTVMTAITRGLRAHVPDIIWSP